MNERLVADFSLQWPEFDTKPSHMVFVVDSLALTLRFFSAYLVSPVTLVSCVRLITPDDIFFCSFPHLFPFFFPSLIFHVGSGTYFDHVWRPQRLQNFCSVLSF